MRSTSIRFAFAMALGIVPLSALASPISDKYADLGGTGGWLGDPTIPEKTAPDGIGKYRHYEHGSIYWSPLTGAHEVHGLIRGRWAELGWEKSYLGYPMTDEIDTYDQEGKVTKFQGGELIWRKATNAVSEVKSTDLVVDLPTVEGQPWKIIQANADPGGSHIGPWAYCYDLVWNGDQPNTKGKSIASSATAKAVWVVEGNTGPDMSNVIVQKLGTGRYASTLHFQKGSYGDKVNGDGLFNFMPQDLAWAQRPTLSSGKVIATTGDVGAKAGAYHIHYCITTAPDVGTFKPFESVPFAFRNFEVSADGKSWAFVPVGVPKNGQWVRRKGSGGAAKVTAGVDVLNFGTVTGSVSKPATHTLSVGGVVKISAMSAWGEPLASKTITLTAANKNGPWSYSFGKVPNYKAVKVTASYAGAVTPDALLNGQSSALDVKANISKTANVTLTAAAPIPVPK